MVQVELNNKTGNPFYGMRNTLEVFQRASKNLSVSNSQLESAWSEADTVDKKALLVSVLFFVGDVSNRNHNIFDGKVENGGNSQREVFRDIIIPFLVKKMNRKSLANKIKFMSLIAEYTTMDNIVAARVRTKKNSQSVISVVNMIDVFGIDNVSAYCADVINKGSEFQKMCLAKFVTRPRFSKRSGNTKMLPETIKVMKTKSKLIRAFSDLCNLPYEVHDSYINFNGYYNWRKEYNQDLESVLFSSGRIKTFDKEQFFELLDKIPSDARFRVRNRVLFDEDEKWGSLGQYYKEWEKFKEKMQSEQRVLESKIEEGEATEKEVAKLAKVKKAAKVNTGAVSFTKLFSQVVTGKIDKIKVQPILDKINLPYNTLVFCDDSGSMNGGGWSTGFTARQMAAFIATICLTKNPDVDARNLVGLFSRTCRMYNGVSSYSTSPNSILNGKTKKIPKRPLLNSNAHFLDNLSSFMKFLNDNSQGSLTNVSSIPDYLNNWVNEADTANRLEEIRKYPVWTLISDGNFNQLTNATSSATDFLKKCENYFGFRPFIILIDVAGNTSQPITSFSGVDNIMIVPPNPSNIELFLTNFRDMDTYDVYTPLLSMSRSNRYAPVRDFVKNKVSKKNNIEQEA